MLTATLRSCWECNSAHEHLKSCQELVCIACGNVYELGVKVGEGPALMDSLDLTDLKLTLGPAVALPIEDLEVTMTMVTYDSSRVKLRR